MDLDETNRQQSYYLIKQKIEEIASKTAPVIVTGDYNAVQTEDSYKLFLNSGFLYDSYTRAKQKFVTNGTCPGFNANNYSTTGGDYRRIDHIFVTRAFNVDHFAVLNPCYYSTSGTASYHLRAFSDHSPVFAKLSLRNPQMAELTTDLPPSENGVYQLSTPEELQAFSYIVNGIAGYKQNSAAKAVLLNDIDMSGMPSIKVLDYTMRDVTARTPEISPQSEFATKDDISVLEKEISSLRSKFERMSGAGEKRKEKNDGK